ncbi:uncharacterized protein LOC111006119 [Momordica charantia]|uniref:Uncharacterized protein LOC111006119 n=1 Tax=Momordica charantia TaxID=3673 RepID=A0A6J1BZH5_MOMCH|nr:uncharacterized protein LOC111006119 [Momordica charantia]
MAAIPSSSLQFPNSLPFPSNSKPHKTKPLTFVTRAADPETPAADPEPGSDGDDFENRLAKVRLKYRSGTGKKAEIRKARKSNKGSTAGAGGSSVYLPPVPLKEAVSGGLKVEFGFSPFSERINGWIAILGISALVLVELATGKGVINYHTPAIILIQVYFVAAVAAVYVKFEKEKVSVWPPEEVKN